ncbi:MAG: hypothetical protein NZ941_00810 [Candidatus Caldarchaeum sp.]|nr:hypothetical protein [Candidatus Caldarchaeum sp.]
MPFRVNNVVLDVVRFSDRPEPVATTVDTWTTASRYKQEVKVIGFIRVWELEVVEPSGPWSSSKAKQMKDLFEAGQPVSFVVDEANLYEVNTTVYITGFAMEIGRERVRRIRLTLQEA